MSNTGVVLDVMQCSNVPTRKKEGLGHSELGSSYYHVVCVEMSGILSQENLASRWEGRGDEISRNKES